MSSFYIENFGCRAARADGEAVAASLCADGLEQRKLAVAEVVVVNTCSVTAEADRDARAFVRRAHRLNPKARIVVTGCYAQRAPEQLAALDGVCAVVGNSHKALVPEIVKRLDPGDQQAGPDRKDPHKEPSASSTLIPTVQLIYSSQTTSVWVDDSFAHSAIESAQVAPGEQTRPNLKIQEGCANRCTFCIIPTTRGASRSLSEERVLDQVNGFVDAGGNELVLSGINLGRWGRDLEHATTLARLVERIVSETRLARLRLSSIEPMDWTEELIARMGKFGGSRLARHAHLPLQSGSDSVLRRMHRRYRPWHYAEKVAALASAVGDELAVGADVMVGFPGESDAEFTETYALIASLPFTYLHLFPFSPRPGTRGWQMHREQPVATEVVRERMHALRQLAEEKSAAFRARMRGRTLPAITLHTPALVAAQGRTLSLTDNFLEVELAGAWSANHLISACVEEGKLARKA
uniref:MiaB-like tRNA modifying enzyme n=1 Tax=mine drainage metagenome TaxID=410659 RepID=E6PXB3_9ZZZZ